ncbi:potassium channel family protein [Microbacterium sp.]|uniref:potassium channel family protein n=1 Tax=Microbacterium sp. TaxID=51671 RepID=UPI0025F815C6|nr:potassium channel family protein [Microbacterium sp.]MBT9607936.1 potassium channel family protein [Microbacterium sp.]
MGSTTTSAPGEDAAVTAEPFRRAIAGRRGETRASVAWGRATYWPLTIAALAFLFAYTFQVIGDLVGVWSIVCSAVVALTWVMFITDYLVRLSLSSPKRRWVRAHLFDVLVVILPTLRPVRLLGAFTRLASFSKSVGSSLRAQMLIYGAGVALLLIWQASLAVLSAERHAPGASITSFGNAVWWAFCTITTVGYGDFTPITVQGRVVAVLLMICGVVLVGLITATFASWVLERVTRGHEDQLPATRADIERVLAALPAPVSDGSDPQKRG